MGKEERRDGEERATKKAVSEREQTWAGPLAGCIAATPSDCQ